MRFPLSNSLPWKTVFTGTRRLRPALIGEKPRRLAEKRSSRSKAILLTALLLKYLVRIDDMTIKTVIVIRRINRKGDES